MQIRIAKSQREDKTAYVAVRAGEMTGFAAVRYDLRSLLRYAGVTLAALIALGAAVYGTASIALMPEQVRALRSRLRRR